MPRGTSSKRKLKDGTSSSSLPLVYRSKYEQRVAANLVAHGLLFGYESETLKFLRSIVRGVCSECGGKSVSQVATYTPDFVIKNIDGTVRYYIETKGLFTAENRATLLACKKQHPDKDIRLLFMRDNKLHKANPRRYSDWCNDNGFKWAVGETIPEEWR